MTGAVMWAELVDVLINDHPPQALNIAATASFDGGPFIIVGFVSRSTKTFTTLIENPSIPAVADW
jgi:hypothetical protein